MNLSHLPFKLGDPLGSGLVFTPASLTVLANVVVNFTDKTGRQWADPFIIQKNDARITTMIASLVRLRTKSMTALAFTQVTDAGLVHLKGLTNLEKLNLAFTQVTDAGLVHLKELTKLEKLNLVVTQITDAGLVHLKGLTNLEKLYLNGTQVTAAGATELKKALPKINIYSMIDGFFWY